MHALCSILTVQCREAILFSGEPIVELKNGVALVTFLDLQSEPISTDISCSKCFILIEASFLTVRSADIDQVMLINASVTYDPLYIEV